MMSALIAIVGRPNVGKSALFNRIVGKRIAIVHDEPGVTRDRISAEGEWQGRSFTLVDTGGIGLLHGEKAGDILVQAALTQVQIAIDTAQVVILVADAKEGLAPLDHEVAQRLRRSGKPVLVAINKVDGQQAEAAIAEFATLGFDWMFPVSALHGLGIAPLMNAVLALLPAEQEPIEAATFRPPTPADQPPDGLARPAGPLKLAVIGRPNVGKSSLVNALTRSERVIVTPFPGTTRDAVDVPLELETDGVRQRYVLIDTAGVRKRRRIDSSIEFFSVKRAEASIRRCDIVLFMLDAEAGILEQDKKIADQIVAEQKACIVVVNKWDLIADQLAQPRPDKAARGQKQAESNRTRARAATLVEFGRWVQEQLFFLDYAPVIFTSAQSEFHLDRLLEAVRYVAAQLKQQIPTALLNRTLHEAIERRQPISDLGHYLKFFYATQVSLAPPTFLLFVNRQELFSPAYEKYLARELRRAFGYEGCPIILVPKPRPRTGS